MITQLTTYRARTILSPLWSVRPRLGTYWRCKCFYVHMNSTLAGSYSSRTKSKHIGITGAWRHIPMRCSYVYTTQLCVFLVTARNSLTLRFGVSTFRSYRGVIKLYAAARDLHIAIFACFPTLEFFENSSLLLEQSIFVPYWIKNAL